MAKTNLDLYEENFSLFELIMGFHLNLKEGEVFKNPKQKEIALLYLGLVDFRLKDMAKKKVDKQSVLESLEITSIGQEVLQKFLDFYTNNPLSPLHKNEEEGE